MTEQDLLFSLDIGTRTVVGIVGFHDGRKFKIEAFEVEEHKERAMYDGQVHDIELVAIGRGEGNKKLERSSGLMLKRVAIALQEDTEDLQGLRRQDAILYGGLKELINNLEIEAIPKS